jgi:hypothetical protein
MSFLCFMFFLNKRLDGGAVGVVLIQFNKRFRSRKCEKTAPLSVPFGSFITASKKCHRCSRLVFFYSMTFAHPDKCHIFTRVYVRTTRV